MRHFDLRKGQVALMLAMSAGLIFGMTGLGIDLLYMTTIRARLGIAADSASLASARNMGRGTTPSEQQAEADAMAQTLFESNFPAGHLMTSGVSYDAPLIEPGPTAGTRKVTVIGRATAPSFFMGFFGMNDIEITTKATAIRRDVNMMLVLDRSGSMFRAGAWPILQTVASDFVDEFDPNRDRMGLVVFGGEARRDIDPDYNFRTVVRNTINTHQALNAGTNIGQGVALGLQGLQNLNDPDAMNLIVLFTDGAATGFNVANQPITRGPCSGQQRDGSVSTSTNIGTTGWGLTLAQAPPPPTLAETMQGGCGFAWGTPLRSYVSALNSTDANGYSLTGPRSVPTPLTPVGNRIRPMAANAALNAALAARTDPTIPTHVYTVGLGGETNPGYLGLDEPLLLDMANDPLSAVYDENQPIGKYFFAATKEQLAAAFEQLKSEIHRIMQ